jgi:hypothetical protein
MHTKKLRNYCNLFAQKTECCTEKMKIKEKKEKTKKKKIKQKKRKKKDSINDHQFRPL